MCVFCEIIRGNIPSFKVYEDDHVLAILDISQATYGHTLVMPKAHYANIFDIPQSELEKVIDVAKKVALSVKERLSCDGVNILNNCGEAAGQSVNHFHIHVIPRYDNDDLKIEFTEHKMTQDEFKKLENLIKIN